jgi:hypothetical protein
MEYSRRFIEIAVADRFRVPAEAVDRFLKAHGHKRGDRQACESG